MEIKLLNSTQEILNLIADLTGKSFEFIHKPDLPTLAMVKIAREKMPAHLVYYKNINASNINHLIAHECGHIYRMMSVPADKRKVPISNGFTRLIALNQVSGDFTKISDLVPLEKMDSIFDMWYNGIIKQLTNFPVDMRIERWIFENYPELRKAQRITIDNQVREHIHVLSEKIKKVTPLLIYDDSNIMNYAFALFMESLMNKKYTAPYKRTNYTELGTRIATFVIDTEDKGYRQDIEIINQWAEALGIKNWFEWGSFEDIPENYTNY